MLGLAPFFRRQSTLSLLPPKTAHINGRFHWCHSDSTSKTTLSGGFGNLSSIAKEALSAGALSLPWKTTLHECPSNESCFSAIFDRVKPSADV